MKTRLKGGIPVKEHFVYSIFDPENPGRDSRNNRGAMICDPDNRVTGIRVCEIVEAMFG